MISKALRVLFVLLLAGIGGYLGQMIYESKLIPLPQANFIPYGLVAISTVAGGFIGIILAPSLTDKTIKTITWFETRLQKTPIQDIVGGVIGLIVGLIIAILLGSAFSGVYIVGSIIKMVGALVFGYLGLSIGTKKKEELLGIFSFFTRFNKDKPSKTEVKSAQHYKIMDTSVIIDGRIADICKSGFIEGVLVIPGFVLEELRHIADSSDLLKRNRGRRGLDILNKIRKELDVMVQINETDFEDLAEVDSKLVRLAQVLGGTVITNDYNLNKVAELQGVKVLNINELANAVKPMVLPGEEMVVQVIKDGKESGQGVAYLDDGTMIVVDNGKKYIGQTISVLVTSVLQTAAGRMIFAKPKSADKKHSEPGHHHYNEVNIIG
ncbi:MAG: PIN/TRAM domain-containing protein [Clostridia bacterium]|nr:PIN/TRAM domain-containing protein [Clostridia bacterium]